MSRARFSSQPGGEALPTEDNISPLEKDPLQEPETLPAGACGGHGSTMDEEKQGDATSAIESARTAQVANMSEANP